MTTNSDAAEAMFLQGYNCAQSVLASCGRSLGLPGETAIKVGQALGGGIGRSGNVCGAVTGAMMVIGLKHSISDPQDAGAKEEAYRLAEELLSRFRARHGSIACRDLLGCDMSTAEGRQKAKEAGLFRSRCPGFVKDAAAMVDEILAGG